MQPTQITPTPATPPAPTGAASTPEPFIHQPRPAFFSSGEHAWMHQFGANQLDAIFGVRSCGGLASTAVVLRSARESHATLRVEIDLGRANSFASAELPLDPVGLRELARRLVDAAADIEAHPAQPKAGVGQ